MLFKRLLYLLPWRRRAAERDMQDELRSIAAMAAPGELGNLALAAEDARAQWGWTRLEQTGQDMRYAVRTLRRAPGFTAAAVLSLAIGIGANTALFTLINTVMWKMLPIRDPEHLVSLGQQTPSGVSYGFTYQQFEIFRDHGDALDLGAYGYARLDVGIDGRDEPTTEASLVTGRYFPLLGLRPAAGRLFDESDDRVALGHPVAVLSHAFWQRRFDADPGVIGRLMTVAGQAFTIVGVTPRDFFGVEVGLSPNLYLPVMMQPVLMPMTGNLIGPRPGVTSTWLRLVGRLKSGRPLEEATARLNALAGTPDTEWRLRNKFSQGFEDTRLTVSSAAAGLSDLRRQFSQPLFILLGVSGLVLLIACANVGHLLLARSATRRPEFALRLALGAGRARVMRQVLVEGLVLSGAGAVAGLVLAYWAAPALVAYATSGQAGVMLDLSPDLRVLGFTTVVTLLAGLLFASAPALRATRANHGNSRLELASASRTIADRSPGRALVVLQVALSVVLLVAAGQFVRSLQNLYRHESDLHLDRVLTVPLAPRGSGSRTAENAPALDRLYRDIQARVEAIPGVQSASLARSSPLGSSTLGFPIALPSGGEPQRLSSTIVYPGYFATVGIPIVKGRDFAEDDLHAGAERAVIVNEAFVQNVLNGGDAIGTGHGVRAAAPRGRSTGKIPGWEGQGPPLKIVGVVKDGRFPGLRDQPAPMVYQTFLQASTGFGQMVLHVRASQDSAEVSAPVADLVRAIERDVPMPDVRTLAQEVGTVLARERLVAALAGIFGLVSLLLISVGLYGLMAFTVSRRTSEIGLRVALGATRSEVRWLVGRQAFGIVLAGLTAGIPAAWIAGRLASRQLSSFLYGVTSTDSTVMLVAAAVLLAVALCAGFLPARRAARIDPAIALRTE